MLLVLVLGSWGLGVFYWIQRATHESGGSERKDWLRMLVCCMERQVRRVGASERRSTGSGAHAQRSVAGRTGSSGCCCWKRLESRTSPPCGARRISSRVPNRLPCRHGSRTTMHPEVLSAPNSNTTTHHTRTRCFAATMLGTGVELLYTWSSWLGLGLAASFPARQIGPLEAEHARACRRSATGSRTTIRAKQPEHALGVKSSPVGGVSHSQQQQ